MLIRSHNCDIDVCYGAKGQWPWGKGAYARLYRPPCLARLLTVCVCSSDAFLFLLRLEKGLCFVYIFRSFFFSPYLANFSSTFRQLSAMYFFKRMVFFLAHVTLGLRFIAAVRGRPPAEGFESHSADTACAKIEGRNETTHKIQEKTKTKENKTKNKTSTNICVLAQTPTASNPNAPRTCTIQRSKQIIYRSKQTNFCVASFFNVFIFLSHSHRSSSVLLFAFVIPSRRRVMRSGRWHVYLGLLLLFQRLWPPKIK